MFKRVAYRDLNSRQQEAFNFQKVSAVLADYGFTTIRLSSDWRGADFIAQHFDGSTFLKVQLKGRATFEKKYLGRDLHICFPDGSEWFLYLSLPKMLSGANAFEISNIQEDETRASLAGRSECNNVTLR